MRKLRDFLSEYKAYRYICYFMVFFIYIPIKYLFIFIFGILAAALEESSEVWRSFVNEFKLLIAILKEERNNGAKGKH